MRWLRCKRMKVNTTWVLQPGHVTHISHAYPPNCVFHNEQTSISCQVTFPSKLIGCMIYEIIFMYCWCRIKKNQNVFSIQTGCIHWIPWLPCLQLSGSVLKSVSSHKYLGVFITTDLKDDSSIRHQSRSTYSRGNIIITNFSQCSVDVKCQLFRSFCTSFYCASLWSSYCIETLRRLQFAYNRIFRILMGLHYRTRMSENLISKGLSPFKVIVRRLIGSFRNRILHRDNILLKTIVDSSYFMYSKLSRKWNTAILNLKR